MPISRYIAGLRQHVGHALLIMPAAAALVRDTAGRLLLMRRADDGVWQLPGGAVDPGEAPAQALVREVYEETGLVVRPRRIVAVVGGADQRMRYPNGDVTEYTTTYFSADVVRGVLGPRDGEALDARTFTDDELALVAPPRLSAFLAALPANVPGALFQWDEGWLDVDRAASAS
jgi:8-oxo-dGTP pyrophosphatase MutT (NUDIX family)